MSLKIIFAGTSAFAVPFLKRLMETKHSVVAVYTQPDRPAGRGLKLTPSPVKEAALSCSLPLEQPHTLKDLNAQARLKSWNADVMVVVAYGLLLPRVVLDTFRWGCINVHPSLLPRWRGAAPIPRAIEAGDEHTGMTIMQLDDGWDTGDILLQESCPIFSMDNTQTLTQRLTFLGMELLVKALDQLEKGELKPSPQDSSRATYAAKIDKTEAKIDWSKDAHVLACQIRAFNPTPVVFTEWNHQSLRIWEAEEVSGQALEGILPGTVLAANSAGIEVATGKGILRLLKIQLAGGKLLSVADVLHARAHQFVPRQTIFL